MRIFSKHKVRNDNLRERSDNGIGEETEAITGEILNDEHKSVLRQILGKNTIRFYIVMSTHVVVDETETARLAPVE